MCTTRLIAWLSFCNKVGDPSDFTIIVIVVTSTGLGLEIPVKPTLCKLYSMVRLYTGSRSNMVILLVKVSSCQAYEWIIKLSVTLTEQCRTT